MKFRMPTRTQIGAGSRPRFVKSIVGVLRVIIRFGDFQELAWKVNDHLADKEGFRHNVYWVTGDLYRGYWSHNKREGNGIHTYRSGDRYEGEWRNGKKEGQGTFWVAVDGKYKAVYRGAWKSGKRHGKGTIYGERGETYEGDFENGERCGTGKQTYLCQDSNVYEVYVGQWSHNKRDGSGILYMGR
ncbi:hypothetical protein GOP47_0027437 [Adiantum capillus-veneris]|nr:hypothetical protein GOP47_0027437 [Adiantum capillus-veneris]